MLALLDQLGWRQRDRRLAGPGDQKLVFVGDLIDRGPQNLRTVEIVRDLVERGDALCLMGNHEFNAVQFHTPDPKKPGETLRPQTDKNRKQHQAVLDEIEQRPGDWKEMLDWFRTLPLAVEGDGWRCVHACWHPPSLEVLEERAGQWFLPEEAWENSARWGSREFKAVETLLKGPEGKLPEGATFLDKDGTERTEAGCAGGSRPRPRSAKPCCSRARPKGWTSMRPTRIWTTRAIPKPRLPVFFGHYWRSGPVRPVGPNAVCLDYSIGKGDRLVARRAIAAPGKSIPCPAARDQLTRVQLSQRDSARSCQRLAEPAELPPLFAPVGFGEDLEKRLG